MKPLEQIFKPDSSSLDVKIGPLLYGLCENDYERLEITKHHKELFALVCSENVPKHIQQNIELSKNLLLYSLYVFDFTTAAVLYAQIALEASLRRALAKSEDCRDNITDMLKEATSKNLLPNEQHACMADLLSGSRNGSRNGLAHGKEDRNVFNQALATPFVQMIIDVINTLFSAHRPDVNNHAANTGDQS
jgi:hypothetical protein